LCALEALGKPLTFVQGDLADRRVLDALFAEVKFDQVIHLAARAGVRPSLLEPALYQRVNVEGTVNLLEAARLAGVKKVAIASSSSVYGVNARVPFLESDPVFSPISPYAASKLACEALGHVYHHVYGMDVVMLRFFTVYGPRQRPDMGFNRFFSAVLAGRPLVQFGDGLQTRDFTYVDDAVTATADAAVRGVPGRVYNIGGGARVSLREVFDLIARVSGRTVTIDHQGPQKGDMRDTYADTSLAAADLGFKPATSLAEGLAAEYAWLQPKLTEQPVKG
jgi:nucleoside-diphosphate-sugar epimerase